MANLGYSQRLQQTVRQDMLLLPRMLQAIEVLQLPVADLEGFLLEAVQENEALRLDDVPPAEPPHDPPGRRGTAEDSARHDAWLENQPGPEQSLVEMVEEQLGMLDLDPDALSWVRLVAGCLDENGCLSISDKALMRLADELELEGDEGDLGRAIGVLQGLEPQGIGGRDAVETLLLQLDPAENDYELICRLLEEFLEDVAKNKLPAVARGLGVEMGHLHVLLERLRELEIAPGARVGGRFSPPIRPDVIVEQTESGFQVRIDQSGLPSVSLDPGVQALARDSAQPADVRRYLRGKMDRGRWLLEAMEQRKRTLMRIATAVFDHQRQFLTDGPGHLAPLRMNDVADELDLHVSTVSRGVAGKYADTPWGIFPMRHFFQSAVGGQDGSAREDVREEVRRIIEGEDPASPLSDDEIVRALADRGVSLARRTVAKYRKELGIPSSYRRRAY